MALTQLVATLTLLYFSCQSKKKKLTQLTAQLEKIGFKPVQDNSDKDAGLISYADNSHKEQINPYMGKTIIDVQVKTLFTQVLITVYALVIITLFFVSALSASGVIVLLDVQLKNGVLLFTTFLTFIFFEELKRQTLCFEISDKFITMKNLFTTRKLDINDIRSVKTAGEGRQTIYEKIIFTIDDKSKMNRRIKTPNIRSNKARLIRDTLIEAIKSRKI